MYHLAKFVTCDIKDCSIASYIKKDLSLLGVIYRIFMLSPYNLYNTYRFVLNHYIQFDVFSSKSYILGIYFYFSKQFNDFNINYTIGTSSMLISLNSKTNYQCLFKCESVSFLCVE